MKKGKKILIIKSNKSDVFFDEFQNIESYYKCSVNNILLRLFRKFNIPFISIFYGEWKNKLNEYDIVILFDNGYSNYIPQYIKRRNKNIKVIFWYWNSLAERKNTVYKNTKIDEFWSYNRFDAEKYKIKYNPQFYFKKRELNNMNIKTDVLFIGRDKGREKDISELQKNLDTKNISTYFKIIKTGKEHIKYDQYLSLLEQSRCILDYSFILPCGLSLRPLEALFYEKKLITNNPDIKNYDFYNPNNIFILGYDNIEEINDFINKPYKKIDEKIINYYSFNSWLSRFLED